MGWEGAGSGSSSNSQGSQRLPRSLAARDQHPTPKSPEGMKGGWPGESKPLENTSH